MICATHNKEYKGPNTKGNFWHVVDYNKGEFCNLPANGVTPANRADEQDFDKASLAMAEQAVKEPFKARDFDAEARGKVRNSVAVAFIAIKGVNGYAILDQNVRDEMNDWVEWIMTGK